MVLLLTGFVPRSSIANDVANPGFEDPITDDGARFANSTVSPRWDVQHLALEIVGVDNRLEWRDSVSNSEIGRTASFVVVPPAAYGQFVLQATVPAFADTACLVYAIQSFVNLPTSTGTVYMDNVSFPVTPVPVDASSARRRRDPAGLVPWQPLRYHCGAWPPAEAAP